MPVELSGGEVDFEKELIYTEAFKNTKAYCVLQALMEIDNDLFRKTISQFTSNNATLPLIFDHSPLVIIDRFGNIFNDSTTEAETLYDEEINIAVITFNSNNYSANGNTLEIAGLLLHEAIHAELFGIINSNNNLPNQLPQNHYEYILELFDFFTNSESSSAAMSDAQHTFMVYNHVEPIAQAVRNLDGNTYSLDNYMAFGWEGLSGLGIPSGVTTQQEITNFINLSQIPLNDNHETSCD